MAPDREEFDPNYDPDEEIDPEDLDWWDDMDRDDDA